ncbi:acyl-CoA dehydrogenase family protein [Croceicoccus sp. F390]|uniref:Acyl-CoA dehydrogenase family protein n=1 Tax=Croceicoccus esteveae TaxID=3075597 RepID=A0ABU2ZKR6_9SPHN|nr:acyl-CoA dehydrogenase family protein [Croceicoccus sp. F390]MDT0576017.1 acyl-CoA dehydrogenase family protein [Croceicoccus sp. F390]
MNFDFDEDQRRLQEEVRRMLTTHSTSAAVRRVLEGAATHDDGTWQQLAKLGALGVALPERHGGAGMGLLELCLIAEEAGRALAAVPLLSSIYMSAEALRLAADDAQQGEWLPRLASGQAIGTAMIAQDDQHALPGAPAKLDGTHLTAIFNAVPDGMVADVLVALAGDALVLVELAGKGVTRSAQTSLDPTRPLARIACDTAPVAVLAASGGAAIAERVTDGAAVLLAFEQVGGAERALYAARDFARERIAFGRPIGGFQAVKHQLAEMYTAVELARGHAYYGAWALATGAPELPRAAAAARLAATEAYTLCAEEGLHLHGGIGFTSDMDCHLHLRRARWLAQIIGNRFWWQERLARELIGEDA